MKPPLRIIYGDDPASAKERTLLDYRHEIGTFAPGVSYLHATEDGESARSFRVDRIWAAWDADTGESIDPWLIDNPGGTKPLGTILRPYAAAICSMHIFIAKTRGFRQRERERFNDFVLELIQDAAVADQAQLCDGAFRLGREAPAREIQPEQMSLCRRHALIIAAGSRRREPEPEILELLEQLFPRPGISGP